MDHNQTIEKEKVVREAEGKNVEAGPSKTKLLRLHSKTKPNTPSPPRHVKAEAVATPPEQPVGSDETMEEPTGNDDAGPALSGHFNVSLNPTGVIDRLIEEAEAVEEQQPVVPEEAIEVINLGSPTQVSPKVEKGVKLTIDCLLSGCIVTSRKPEHDQF
ncbi:unnamed protein product [Calypogeia fissa]